MLPGKVVIERCDVLAHYPPSSSLSQRGRGSRLPGGNGLDPSWDKPRPGNLTARRSEIGPCPICRMNASLEDPRRKIGDVIERGMPKSEVDCSNIIATL